MYLTFVNKTKILFMKIKGKHSVNYTISGKKESINVVVELKQVDGLGAPKQNIYKGIATIDGNNFEHPDLPNCVNAEYMAESIVFEKIQELRKKYGKKLRVKKM